MEFSTRYFGPLVIVTVTHYDPSEWILNGYTKPVVEFELSSADGLPLQTELTPFDVEQIEKLAVEQYAKRSGKNGVQTFD